MNNIFIVCFVTVILFSLVKKSKVSLAAFIFANIILLVSAVATLKNIEGCVLCLIYLTALCLAYRITKKMIGFLDYDMDTCGLSIRRLQTVNHTLDQELNWMAEEIEFLKKGYTEQRVLTEMLWKMSKTMEFYQIFDVFLEHAKSLVSFRECRLLFIDNTGPGVTVERQFVYPESAKEVTRSELSFMCEQFSLPRTVETNYTFFESKDSVFCLFNKVDKYQPLLIVDGLDSKEKLCPLIWPFYLELKESYLYERVKVLSIRDGLTNLYKRQYFFLSLEEEIERAASRKDKFSILLADIDNFKSYNDKYGHLTGDCILREFGAVARGTLRQNDLVGRYGGEEFIFFLSDTDYDGAVKMAQRLERIIKNNDFIIPSGTINITLSCGVAVFPDNGKTVEELIAHADKKMYEAKNIKKADIS